MCKGVCFNKMEREEVDWCRACKEDDVLFNDSILQQLDCTKFQSYINYGLSIQNPGPGLIFRSLQKSDYEKGYVALLSQLAITGEVTKERFDVQFEAMKQCPGVHYIMVIEDRHTSKVIASGTLVIERKFTHNTALRGRVEDIVVDCNYRGKQLGKLIVETVTMLSQYLGCYKTSLDCLPTLRSYYETFEYVNTSVLFMSRKFYE